MMKLDYCYHTHTKRCGHAIGEDREYVLSALSIGLKRMGFSDHLMIPGVIQPKVRGNYEQFPGYIRSVQELKTEFASSLDIKLGMECEYAPHLLPYYQKLKQELGFDYLLLGQHRTFHEDGSVVYYFSKDHPGGDISSYASDLISGMRSHQFLYVCHPDLYVICKREWDEECESIAHMIVSEAVKQDIPLELNVNGRTWKDSGFLKYSCENFWKVASQYPVKVVLGYDAHAPEHFYRPLDFFEYLIEKYSLNLIDLKV